MPIPPYVLRLREAIQQDWLMMVGAAAIIRDEQGRFLLQKRSDLHIWGLPGGSVEPGEDPALAAIREAKEETGLDIEIIDIAGVYSFSIEYPGGDKVWGTSTTFLCRAIGGELALDDDETLELRYFAPDELPEALASQHSVRLKQILAGRIPYFDSPLVHPENREYVSAMREKIGHDLLMLVSAEAIIQDEQGRVLLQRRSNGEWGVPGGSSHLFENPAQTVIREVKEETGLDVTPEKLVGVYGGEDHIFTYPNGDVAAHTSYTFLCRVIGGGHAQAHGESRDVAYFPFDSLPETMRPEHRLRVEHAFTRTSCYFRLP